MAKYNFALGVDRDTDTDARKGIRREKACKWRKRLGMKDILLR